MAAPQDIERVRARAYELWEQQGRPAGRELDFWSEAERQLEVEFRVGYPDGECAADAREGSKEPAVPVTSTPEPEPKSRRSRRA